MNKFSKGFKVALVVSAALFLANCGLTQHHVSQIPYPSESRGDGGEGGGGHSH